MNTNKDATQQYLEARIAARGATDPEAFVRLGTLYAQGVGTTTNHVLANYFFHKAARMGCQEVYDYITKEYELGTRNLMEDIEKKLDSTGALSPEDASRFGKMIESIRAKKYYGLLSMISQHIHLFYPDYQRDKAISDILNGRDTVDADILYSQSTSDNGSEFDIESQESLLSQLFAPVSMDEALWEQITMDALGHDEKELTQALSNLTSSYDKICQQYDVEKKEVVSLDSLGLLPYIHIPSLVQIRKQVFTSLLSIKDLDPIIQNQFLDSLCMDEKLLNICEEIEDYDIQLFLISFVEINIDIDVLETKALSLLRAFRANNVEPLAEYLNEYVNRLTALGIKHHIPVFTSTNLPTIKLPV
jgi:hypothetical protein